MKGLFWRSSGLFLLDCVGLTLLTFVCFQLQATLAAAALLYLVAIVLISLQGRIVPALLSSVVALLCLDYFFVEPIFAFGPIQPEDVVALFTFLTTALVVTTLVSRMRSSERQWKDVFENNPTMYFIVNASGTIRSVNPFGAGQLGYSVKELIGQPVLNVFYEPDQPLVQKNLASCLEQLGKSMSWEFRKVRKDGTVIWVREMAKAVARPGGPTVLVACEDITAAKRSQEELEHAFQEIQALRDEFGRIIDTIPDMIYSALPDGSVDFVNRRWVEYTGLSLKQGMEEARRRGWTSSRHTDVLLHPEDVSKLEAWRASRGDFLKTAERYESEFRFRRADGEYRRVLNRALPLRDQQGNIIKWYGVSVDIEDQKRAEEAMRKTQAQLAHVTRVTALGELAASIAHEVNQPLTAIINNANACVDLLPSDTHETDEVREALSDIVSDAGRASAILSRIRELLNKSPLQKTRLHLQDVVSSILVLARNEAATRRVTIQTEIPEDLPVVLGDHVQLQQVLLNLIMNGMDAMNGVEEQKRLLLISGRRDTHDGLLMATIVVQDFGIGLKTEEMDHLFEAFYTTKSQGLGMGLAISRSIIEEHGGRLWAEPNKGPGATFLVSLPHVLA
jgi:PAS domain S-box-containing protein